MDDAPLVSVLHGLADLGEQLERFLQRQLLVTDVFVQRPASDVVHDVELAAVGGLAGVEDGDDVRMPELGDQLDLALEALLGRR